jgi:two-component system, NarL family, sensor histidine kinase UhpB
VQEGLINALRHAHAAQIEITLESGAARGQPEAQRMIVTVSDDGVGLPASWSRPGHFGLRGLTERVEHLGGQLTIGNRDPHGVCLTAEIPLVTAKMPTAVAP